jgi:hypothetical protein
MRYSAWAAKGEGVDRHLFGLKKSLKDSEEELPELYKDEAYAKSSHWEMSTSQLSSSLFDGWGYGEGELLSIQTKTRTRTNTNYAQWYQMVMASHTL